MADIVHQVMRNCACAYCDKCRQYAGQPMPGKMAHEEKTRVLIEIGDRICELRDDVFAWDWMANH